MSTDTKLGRNRSWFWGLFSREDGEHGKPCGGDDVDHIFCGCRPYVMLCGKYDDGPVTKEGIDGSECPECLRIWNGDNCPVCPCTKDRQCDSCERKECD